MCTFGMWSGFPGMWMFPIVFMGIALYCLYRMFKGRAGAICRFQHTGESAKEILDRRFASGEITREQYQEIKQVLEQ